MIPAPRLYWSVVGVILLTAVVSGPLVPLVDHPAATGGEGVPIERYDATVSVLSVPTEEFQIASQKYESTPALFVPPATVRVDTVVGEPTLVYEVTVPDLHVTAVTLYFISEANEGRELRLETTPTEISRNRLTEDRYRAAVSIRVRTADASNAVYETNVTVPVVLPDDA